MQVKKSTLNSLITIGILILISILGLMFVLGAKGAGDNIVADNSTISFEGDSQIIEITAKGGYSPKVVEAKANTATTLRMITKNTFDCSTALVIPKLGINKNLPINGKT